MRPRSRLLSKRGLLLPTIREGAEETVRDLNEANALHAAGRSPPVSSEDYLLSICHLAHPTFPVKDPHPANVHQRLRLSRLGGAAAAAAAARPDLNPAEAALWADARRGQESKLNNKGVFGSSDPLEFLYGHQSGAPGLASCRAALLEGRFLSHGGRTWEGQAPPPRALGPPHASDPPQRGEEGRPGANSDAPGRPGLEARGGGPAEREAEGERPNAGVKQSLISQWISDCRSAWREARVRACVLPAIAEI